MMTNQRARYMPSYSPLDLAARQLRQCIRLTKKTLFLPLPLVVGAVLGFNHFQPHWHTDVFLCLILLLFASGQVGSLFQLLNLNKGLHKAAATLGILKKAGNRPDLENLQKQLVIMAPSCHIRDNILRWIQLGLQGETEGIERMMEHASVRRDQSASRIISFHSVINRTTLKMGFLGTLIGLMMTFDPMKQAMLSLQNSQGEFKFVTDIVRAIDADSYAILTTLFATGLSIFIEIMTIQLIGRILHQFEMVNNSMDDWCIIHLQPFIRESAAGKKSYDALVEFQKQFAEKIAAMQQTMDAQVRALSECVSKTGEQIAGLIPVQQAVDKKIAGLATEEEQYRRFLQSKLERIVPSPDETRGPQ